MIIRIANTLHGYDCETNNQKLLEAIEGPVGELSDAKQHNLWCVFAGTLHLVR